MGLLIKCPNHPEEALELRYFEYDALNEELNIIAYCTPCGGIMELTIKR